MASKTPAAEDAQAPAPKKKSKLPMIAAAVIVLALVGGGGAFFMMRGKPAAPVAPKPKPQLFLALDPPFVVNFQDQGQIRFLQVGIEVMANDPKAIEAVKTESPVIRNALLMLLSGQDAKALMTRQGKEKLRAEAQAEIQKVLAKDGEGKPGIKALYFTSFVMQ
jgi:flagellar FliL protein